MHKRLAAALLIATTAVLAGCGSSSKAPAVTQGSSNPLVPAAVPSIVSQVPAAIRSKGSITMAVDATYPPDEFVAADGQTIVGLDADLGTALASIMGLKANLTKASFDTIIPGLQSGKYDLGVSSFTDTKKREQVVNFVDYFQAGEAFYVKASSGLTLNGLSALCGKSVSVESGTTEQSDATGQSAACTKAGKPAVKVYVYNDQNEANLAVSSGRADAGFADSQVAAYIVKQSAGAFQLSGSAFSVVPYGIAVPKTTGLTQPVLAAFQAMMSDGAYGRILAKWGLQTGAISAPAVNGATS